MAKIHLKQVKKTYGKAPKAVDVIHGIDIDIADGEFIVMVGPSGCGKSTLLRMVAGLEEISSGEIVIGDRVVNQLEPKERDIAMVFQNYALYPHMSVYENMAYGLKIQGLSKAEIDTRVQRAAEILELGALLQRTPRQLSGGQRQRVAMGRAIVRKPAVFLFDEPLSNLDAKLRVQMRLEIQKLHAALRTTSLYVTHDQVEAMTLGASFIGSPPMNLLQGQLNVEGSVFTFEDGSQLSLPVTAQGAQAGAGARILGIRPEHLQLGAPGLPMQVELVEALGAELLVHTRCGGQSMVIRCTAGTAVSSGQSVTAGFDAAALHWFDPVTTHRLN